MDVPQARNGVTLAIHIDQQEQPAWLCTFEHFAPVSAAPLEVLTLPRKVPKSPPELPTIPLVPLKVPMIPTSPPEVPMVDSESQPFWDRFFDECPTESSGEGGSTRKGGSKKSSSTGDNNSTGGGGGFRRGVALTGKVAPPVTPPVTP